MGILSMLVNQHKPSANVDERAVELKNEILAIEGLLHQDWNRRLNGDGIYSGYKTLRDFYKGRQWSFKKEGGGTMRTYNYCFTVVENMTAFLTNEAPQMSCPAKDLGDSVEQKLAEGRTKLLKSIHDTNDLPITFQKAARTGSLCGDAFIFGPIPTFKVDDEGNRTFDNIRYWNVERPENIRVIWKDENFNEVAGFVNQYRIELATAKRMFKHEIEKSGLRIVADGRMEGDTTSPEPTEVPMITVKQYWDDREYLLMLGTTGQIVDYMKHDWGFVPLQVIPNIHIPGEARGTSDLENELDPQQEYNERSSDLADIIQELARPVYWGKNLDNMSEVRSGQTVIYNVGDDAEINAMPRSGTTAPVESYIADRKNDMISLSGMNQVLYPGNQVLQSTGRALSVVMQGVNNKISLRKDWWVRAFKNINRGILFLAERYVPEAKLLIGGYYETDVFISSVLLRSVSDEINKFQAKLQSLRTTQQNVGIPSPSEEQKLMKEELQDEILATEIAKQPGLLHQILADRTAQMNAGGGMGAANMAGVNAPPPGIAPEGDTAPGGDTGVSPMPGQAPRMTPQGVVNAMAQRSGAAPKVKAKK